MLIAETCLLRAVRDRLRTELSLREHDCDIELDDQVPAIAEHAYYAVTAAGTTPGERHQSSGTVWDLRMNVRVTLYQRTTEVARDRRRNVFIDLLTGMNKRLDDVILLLDNNQTLRQAAQAMLAGTAAAEGEFPEPFRTFTPDPIPRPVFRDPYDAAALNAPAGDPTVGLARSVTFQRARFMMERF